MAGRGPAPKLPGERRRHGAPARGEWTDLEPLRRPVLPRADPSWSANAKRMYAEWRKDPVTVTYSPAAVAAVRELARRYDELTPGEQRLRMDGLALTPRGMRDLRFRAAAEAKLSDEPAKVKRLKLVERPLKDGADAAEPG